MARLGISSRAGTMEPKISDAQDSTRLAVRLTTLLRPKSRDGACAFVCENIAVKTDLLPREQVRMIRARKRFGWLKTKGDYFNDYHLPPNRQVMPILFIDKRHHERLFPGREYFAIVYEQIEEDELDDERVPRSDKRQIAQGYRRTWTFCGVLGSSFAARRFWTTGKAVS